jgi:hypothetical protein
MGFRPLTKRSSTVMTTQLFPHCANLERTDDVVSYHRSLTGRSGPVLGMLLQRRVDWHRNWAGQNPSVQKSVWEVVPAELRTTACRLAGHPSNGLGPPTVLYA